MFPVSGDERLLVKEVVHFFDDTTLEPGHYNYPALFSYLYAGTLYLVRALGGLDQVGGIHLPMGFALTFNIVLFALISRIFSILAGVALVADWVLLSIILPTFLYIGSWNKADLHYIIFLAPLAGLLAARLVLESIPRLHPAWGLAFLALLSLPNVWHQTQQGMQLSQPDVRLQAARWIEENIPNDTVIGGYWISYLPPLKGLKQREKLHELIDGNRHSPQTIDALHQLDQDNRFYKCVRLHYFMNDPQIPATYVQTVDQRDPKSRRIFSNAWLTYEDIRRFGVEYVLLSNAAYGRFIDTPPPPAATAAHFFFTRSRDFISQFFAPQNTRYQLVKEFVDDGTRISLLKVLPEHSLVTALNPSRSRDQNPALQ